MNYIKNYSITFNASSLEFQSTPSVGRATNGSTFEPPLFHDFNPRPPWGGRRFTTLAKTWDLSFQSTPSVGRATPDLSAIALPSSDISIHALRGEGDNRPDRQHTNAQVYFNPRPPWGGRPKENSLTKAAQTFQSTPSVGRATALTGSIQTRKYISIHALRGEGDTPASAALSVIRYFNPRPPWGGRHRLVNFIAKSVKFQSTPSVGRATRLFKRF